MTTVRLTKFEKTRVIGERANQLSNGAPPAIDIGDMDNALVIATEEFNQNKIPFIIERYLLKKVVQEVRLMGDPE